MLTGTTNGKSPDRWNGRGPFEDINDALLVGQPDADAAPARPSPAASRSTRRREPGCVFCGAKRRSLMPPSLPRRSCAKSA